ncbi:MAG: MBL fold metallo-hydrolase [Bacteriovoracaceae bacterium]|jgi:phosphoribosyl 1,2-cyclic phosphodiesterase|nr:MBL fold metallo-hydrolase [Bacteriovoracaceae bacterium]
MEVKLHGVRGSLPTPMPPKEVETRIKEIFDLFFESGLDGKEHLDMFLSTLPNYCYGGFGGNSTCIEVKSESSKIILDGGTGLRHSVEDFFKEGAGEGKAIVHLVLTHFHWDHLMGIPFFSPIYIPGNEINFYAVQPELQEVIRALFKKPFFPVPYETLAAKINFHQLSPRSPKVIGDIKLTPYQLDHPDPCWGFKIENKNKTYAHCVDTEAIRLTREELGDDLPLYQNVDLMLFDAQYSYEEAQEKLNWGHASAPKGLELALREKVKEIIFTHHDPLAKDEHITKLSKLAENFFERPETATQLKENKQTLRWAIAREGMVIKL